MQVPEVLSRYREAVDAGLKSALSEGDHPIFDMQRYHMGWLDKDFLPMSSNAGKAVRPTLCLFACEAVGGEWSHALPAAVSIELLHNFSLVHDDIQDGDTERRHRQTVWYLWGYSHGLNTGTAMHIVANQALPRLGATALSPELVLEVSRILTQASMEMIEGQALDVRFERTPRVSSNDYLVMIEKKTGALLEASLRIGATIGTGDTTLVKEMSAFGHSIGRLFQVRDDILGVWGKAEDTGKPAASDLHRRKKSLPVVHALENAGINASGKKFADIYRTKDALSGTDIEALLMIMDEFGTFSFCHGLAQREAEKALQTLRQSPLSPWAKQQGGDLVEFLLEREY
ncbi:MAG: polyprenyl synthetase [Dehalococcoidia bacterium]|nr:polyprenyl synthetase [Dehalococcoidia bacterium]